MSWSIVVTGTQGEIIDTCAKAVEEVKPSSADAALSELFSSTVEHITSYIVAQFKNMHVNKATVYCSGHVDNGQAGYNINFVRPG